MKKILSSFLLIAVVAIAFTGCLKDKGFDNHTYGINDPDTQPPGVGFPFAANAKNDFGLDAGSTTNQFVNGLLYVNLEAGNPASSDVHVTLANTTTALLAAYNLANGTAILPLPAAIYSFPTALTILAGATNTQVALTVTNTTSLNPNNQYAVAITISAVDGGYKIADNLKNLFIIFGIKNQYDGKYNFKGQNYHPSANPNFTGFTTTVEMWTTGPNSVKIYWPAAGAFAGPSWLGGLSYFGLQEPEITVNPSTNAITVQNTAAGAVTFYTMGMGFDNLGYNSRWVPGTKTMYFNYGYNLGPGGTFTLGTSREWIDTAIRTGPR